MICHAITALRLAPNETIAAEVNWLGSTNGPSRLTPATPYLSNARRTFSLRGDEEASVALGDTESAEAPAAAAFPATTFDRTPLAANTNPSIDSTLPITATPIATAGGSPMSTPTTEPKYESTNGMAEMSITPSHCMTPGSELAKSWSASIMTSPFRR